MGSPASATTSGPSDPARADGLTLARLILLEMGMIKTKT